VLPCASITAGLASFSEALALMFVLPLILGLDRLPYLRVHSADRMLAAEHRFRFCWSLRSLILMASGVELAFAA